jgi:hypothetical protein
MSYILTPWPKFQYVDDHGNPLANGSLWTYKSGTSTPQVTYSSASGAANSNPVILDANGSADVWIDQGLAYKYVLRDTQGAIVYTVDNINSQGSNMGDVTVLTIAALKALSVSAANIKATVLGYYAANDGGGGDFLWSPTSVLTADNGMVVASNTTANGRWLRIANGEVNVLWYGANGSNTSAISDAAVYATSTGWPIRFPKGIYLLDTNPGFTTAVILDPGAKLSWGTSSPYGLPINPVITDNGQHFVCTGGAWAIFDKSITDIRPEWFGAQGDGSLTNNTPGTDDTAYFATALASATTGCTIRLCASKKYWVGPLTWKAGVNLKSDRATGSSTEAVLTMNTAGDMITLTNAGVGGLQGGEICGVTLDANGYTGNILVLQTKGSDIHDCTLRNAVGTAIILGGTQSGSNNKVTNNTITNCSGGIVDTGTRTGNSGNIITNNTITATAGIYLQKVNGVSVVDNNITAESFGVAAYNDQTGVATISNNLISVSGSAGKGIAVVSSGTPSSLSIQNNVLTATGSDSTGIDSVGYFPGLIADNVVNGYTVGHYTDSTVSLRYTTNDATQAMIINSGAVVINDVTPTAGYALDVNGALNIRTNLNVAGNVTVPTGNIVIGSDQTFASWLPIRGFIDGFTMTLDSTTVYPGSAHNLTVGSGSCRDSGELVNINLASGITKSVTTVDGSSFVAWGAGSGQGGVYSGETVSEGLWLHVFAIQDATGTADIFLQSDVNGTNVPAGYVKRRIGSVCIVALPTYGIRRFTQHGNDFSWDLYSSGSQYHPTVAQTILPQVLAPNGVSCKSKIVVNYASAWDWQSGLGFTYGFVSDPNCTNAQQIPVYANTYWAFQSSNDFLPIIPQHFTHAYLEVYTDTSRQVRFYQGTASGDTTVTFDTCGWTDNRGKL